MDSYRTDDRGRLCETIGDREIARSTLTVPHPYTMEDADWWLQQCEQQEQTGGKRRQWAIRNAEGLLCGGIGLHWKYGADSHKDELGYWLMRDLWGRGIMTAVVGRFTDYCFNDRGLARLEAPVFDFNRGSARVLEKNSFLLEGTLRKAYLKGEKYYDSLLYAKVVE